MSKPSSPRRRKRHAALGDLLPQNVCIVELRFKSGLYTLGIQIMPCGIPHALGKLRQVIDKPAVNACERHMLIGPTGDKGKPHIARQQLKRHLALDGQHRAVQTKLTCDKAAIEVVTGNLPIGRQNRDGNRQVKTAASFADIAGCQVDGNARPRNLEAGRAHGAPDTPARLHHLHTRNAEHLDAWNATGKRDLDGDGNCLDAADAGRVYGKRLKRHHDTCQSNALYWCSISAICPPRMVTPTASKRIDLSG